MRCNAIAQRIALQEYLTEQAEEINQRIEKLLTPPKDEKGKELSIELDRSQVEALLDEWLQEYALVQPDDFFRDHPTNDTELVCSVQTSKDFLLSTLEFFGLPKGYMDGAGHFPDWGKQQQDKKKKLAANKQKQKVQESKIVRQMKKQMKENKEGKKDNVKPTHFDLEVFQKCFNKFVGCSGEMRSKLRKTLLTDINKTMKVFLDENNEQSFKKCVDLYELARKLQESGIGMEEKDNKTLFENLGNMLLCFGDIENEPRYGERIPEDTEEDRRQRERAKELAQKREEARELAEEQGVEFNEAEYPILHIEPKKPVMRLLHLISITDMKFCAQKMFEFDKILYEMGIQKYDISDEKEKMAMLTQKYKKKFYDEDEEYTPEDEPSKEYSTDARIQEVVSQINDLTSIPEVPDSLKNAFAVTLFCMEAAFDSRSQDFLKHAFDEYPDRDYLIITQPHTVVESQLLSKFTLPAKKTKNTFQHVLYIMHRDFLFEQDMVVKRISEADLEAAQELITPLDEAKSMYEALYECAVNPACTNYGFVAKVFDQVIGAFVLSKDVNLEYYISHFHIQDQVLIAEQDRKSHTRLIHSCVNPIFEKSTRIILKELLRLTQKTCMYFEVNHQTIIPPIFHDLVHVRSRRFPHFLDRKWDHERFVSEDAQKKHDEDIKNRVDGCQRDPLDEEEPPFALCFSTRRILSEAKIIKNARVVVVGASDTSISFIEALLSISYLHFTNIVLVAPGGLPHNHFSDKHHGLKAYSTSYTSEELRKLMLESRVRVINARMVDIDRSDKNIILHDNTVIPYDTLVLGMGIQDKTLATLGYCSRGIAPLPPNIENHCDGILSIDDPYLYQHLRQDGSLISILTDKKRVKNCVVYGRSLHTYCCIQGLIERGVKPEQIILAIPSRECHVFESTDDRDEREALAEDLPFIYPEAFEDEQIESKIQSVLEQKGVRIIRRARLSEIEQDPDEGLLEAVVFKMLDVPEEEEDEDELEGIEDKSDQNGSMGSGVPGTGDEGSELDEDGEGEAEYLKNKKKKRKKNELEVECKVLITAGHRDVDQDVFSAIHNNGLVYNGRLIVDRSFQTTDPSIFAAGSLTEFSGRYKALSQGRPLRMDRYNGREMGSRLARSVFDIYDSQANPDGMDEELPQFYLPQGHGGVLPGGILYYHIKTTNPLIYKQKDAGQEEALADTTPKTLTCDNLDISTQTGHFIQFTFNRIGLIDSVTYMGSHEVILQSLQSFVGLHENYLNSLTSRYEKGIIPNAVEFLSENWAIALYHEWFGDFCVRMRVRAQGMADVQAILEKALEATKNGEGISRQQIHEFRQMLEPGTVRMIQEETLEFIKTNMNHLPMYYIPQKEFN